MKTEKNAHAHTAAAHDIMKKGQSTTAYVGLIDPASSLCP